MEPSPECQVEDVRRCAHETRDSLTRLRVHAASPDGAVLVVLTASGRLDRLTLRPSALRYGPDRLATLIAETIRHAHQVAGEQVQAALQPLLGWSRSGPGTADDREFGELVRDHRRGRGLSQEDLSARSGLGVRGLRKIETHQVTSPRPATVRLLADALGLSGRERDQFFTTALCRP